MTVAQALWLGVLQGATEFLPVSSSGHLALAESLLPGGQEPELLFDLLLHLATLLAIAVILRRRILDLALAGLSLLSGRDSAARRTDRRWLGLLVVASVPTALLGLALRELVGEARGQPVWVGASLLVTAALLILSERVGRRDRGAADLGVGDAVVIGAVQGLAVMPGISRSGSTIAAALCRNSRAEPDTGHGLDRFLRRLAKRWRRWWRRRRHGRRHGGRSRHNWQYRSTERVSRRIWPPGRLATDRGRSGPGRRVRRS